MNKILSWSQDKSIYFASGIFFIFIFLHLFGIYHPYHQDEYKWVQYSHPEIIPPGTVPHPPLTEFIYTKIAPVFGDDGFRFIPFSFGIINLFLLFYLIRFLYDKNTASISVSIFALSFFSLLASLMVDVDGAVMPFFFLLFLIGYFKWKNFNFSLNNESYKWILLLLVGAIGGFLIKVSAILPILAISIDFALFKNVLQDRKKIIKYVFSLLIIFVGLVLLLFVSKFIFPFFNLKYSIGYWQHFSNFTHFFDRGWLQTAIQTIKALLYSSPFLILVPLFLKKEDFLKLRVFFIFIGLAFIFYVILFDFSLGALDRYWQLLVIPLTIFSSVAISKNVEFKSKRTKEFLFLGIILSLIFIILQSINHYVPPLHPKTEWISRVLSFKWNFVYPFSGGSGPLGFYVSFLFMSLVWIVSILAVVLAFFKKEYKKLIIIFLLPLGIAYNLVFIEEYLFGFWNGSSSKLLRNAVELIKNNPEIEMVTVYNDNGGWDIQAIGKYRKRLYIDPKFDVNEKVENLNKYKEHYLVLDIPKIDQSTVYQKYFNSCAVAYNDIDKKISVTIYDCRRAPDVKV